MNWQSASTNYQLNREEIGPYVAELQLHMTLQARNLLPTLSLTGDGREQLLHETQAQVEKLTSRQALI